MSTTATSDPPVLDIDLTVHDLYRGGFPHELFRELRDEHPVWRHPHTTLTRAPEGMEFWVVLGHPEYYPKFGFVRASTLGWRSEYEVRDEAFMAIELRPGTLGGKPGTIRYHAAFAGV